MTNQDEASIIRSRRARVKVAIAVTGTLLAASALLTGCGSAGAAGATGSGGGQSITLYNGQHQQTANALVTAFEKQTGITVNIRNADEGSLANLIAVQGQNSPADVFYTENSPALEFLQGKGLLAATDPATLSQTPSQYNSPQRDWAGVSARVSVLIYNPALIARSQLPASVLQLADSKYQGKLALAAGETDFQPIVTSVLKTYGQAKALHWLQGIKTNAASHLLPDNETLVNDVNRGTVAFGVIDQYYWYRLRAQDGAAAMHSQLAYFAPRDPGYVLDVSGAAVLKSSKHQAAAQKFLAFLVSKQGQQIIGQSSTAAQSFEYPIASGVTSSAPETPFGQLKPNPITIGDLGDGSTAIALLRQAGLL